ncbi:FAD binding domain-containing protein [Halpernia frigidisoli]|uniref:Xanthine dehydrogenase YagS FAD-binding subunit n=1 Tax=Halpernia frigidisoli TaxID=1125876 RepID=A0A1I3D4R8_9FLAO|nr:xanthine dehydrogenase family protein subunit M [Halpernia frigidisoli]SFH81712.1 xanthine dehydrogenase YagS FAD-binding subunit [Halpernia frigidisoli]
MRAFKYSRATEPKSASKLVSANEKAQFLAGGTNVLDLMKEDVERPTELVDISKIQLTDVTESGNLISIGGLGKNTATANHPLIRNNFPMLTQAILAGASAQIRNMATNGGNLNQRTRCSYFFETAMPCNKREPGSGCGALEGVNRMHAIFGWSESCIAVHPSDMCIPLVALDAVVKIQGVNGEMKNIPFSDYHRLPGNDPQKDNNLVHGELITSIDIPKNNFANNSCYLKIRDRSSYAFALISVAAALELDGKSIKDVRLAMGGVSHKPWRALAAEKFLKGKTANMANFKIAAEEEMKSAKAFEHNQFKIEMGKKAIVRALSQALDGGTA